jgi:hypothetical protein
MHTYSERASAMLTMSPLLLLLLLVVVVVVRWCLPM